MFNLSTLPSLIVQHRNARRLDLGLNSGYIECYDRSIRCNEYMGEEYWFNWSMSCISAHADDPIYAFVVVIRLESSCRCGEAVMGTQKGVHHYCRQS